MGLPAVTDISRTISKISPRAARNVAKEVKKAKVTVLRTDVDVHDPKAVARAVNVAWRRAGGSILDAAHLISIAKANFKRYSEWPLFKEELDIDDSKVSKLYKIGSRKAFYVESNIKHVPPCLSTLYTLAQAMTDDQLLTAFRKGDIHNNMTLEDAVGVVAKYTGKQKNNKNKKDKAEATETADADEASTTKENKAKESKGETKAEEVKVSKSSEDDDFERAVGNFTESMDSLAMFIELLDNALERIGRRKLPPEAIKQAKSIARNLDRIVQQYS